MVNGGGDDELSGGTGSPTTCFTAAPLKSGYKVGRPAGAGRRL